MDFGKWNCVRKTLIFVEISWKAKISTIGTKKQASALYKNLRVMWYNNLCIDKCMLLVYIECGSRLGWFLGPTLQGANSIRIYGWTF